MPLILIVFGVFSFQFTEASTFQDQITRSYPGFKILSRSEFDREVFKEIKSDPALITGQFSPDSKEGFAALIRAPNKKVNDAPGNKYEYYDGKLVACLATKTSEYKCQEISSMPITVPYHSYLIRAGRKKTACQNENGEAKTIDVKTDTIGWYFPEKGGSDYIFQPNGSFLNCVTSD